MDMIEKQKDKKAQISDIIELHCLKVLHLFKKWISVMTVWHYYYDTNKCCSKNSKTNIRDLPESCLPSLQQFLEVLLNDMTD